jgi:hypothetical protein
LIDLNRSPHCRHSGDEATLETLGGESNNDGVVIAGLALRIQQLLHEICMRVKNVRLGTSDQDQTRNQAPTRAGVLSHGGRAYGVDG